MFIRLSDFMFISNIYLYVTKHIPYANYRISSKINPGSYFSISLSGAYFREEAWRRSLFFQCPSRAAHGRCEKNDENFWIIFKLFNVILFRFKISLLSITSIILCCLIFLYRIFEEIRYRHSKFWHVITAVTKLEKKYINLINSV